MHSPAALFTAPLIEVCRPNAYARRVPGTVVYYDDVEVVKADKGGELRAHAEMTAKYRVRWRHVHDSCWVCESVGGAAV